MKRNARREAKQKTNGIPLPPMPELSEEEKRRKALEMHARLFGNVPRAAGQAGAGEDPAPGTLNPAAGGRAGPGGISGKGQKNAESSAGARAPEAQAAANGKAAEPEIPESRKTKPNRRENEFMLNMMVLRNTLHQNAPACRERARLAGKWIWRDIRLLTVLVERVQDALLRTMPASRDEYYCAYARHGHYELHIDGPIRTARHVLVTDKHLAAICEAAMKSECILCMREGNEIGRCELREALLEAAPPTAIADGDNLYRKCEYRDAAGALVQGRDVSI